MSEQKQPTALRVKLVIREINSSELLGSGTELLIREGMSFIGSSSRGMES